MFRMGRCEVRGQREVLRDVPHGEVRGSRTEGGLRRCSARGGARSRHYGWCREDPYRRWYEVPSTVHPKGIGWLVGAALYTLKELGGWKVPRNVPHLEVRGSDTAGGVAEGVS